jgi:hypothetical protein
MIDLISFYIVFKLIKLLAKSLSFLRPQHLNNGLTYSL